MQEKHSIDSLLAEARCITKEQLAVARQKSTESGLPVGRILVLMGAIKPTQLVKATDLQRLLQAGTVSMYEAAQQLMAESTASGSKFFIGRKRKTAERGTVKVGELLTNSGALAESHLLDALEISLMEKTPVGTALIKLGAIDESMLERTLDLQAKVNQGEMEKEAAIMELRWVHRANKLLSAHQNN